MMKFFRWLVVLCIAPIDGTSVAGKKDANLHANHNSSIRIPHGRGGSCMSPPNNHNVPNGRSLYPDSENLAEGGGTSARNSVCLVGRPH